MNEQLRDKAAIIYNVVESVILVICVGLTSWTATTVIAHGNTLSRQTAIVDATSQRVDRIETRGSAGLESHVTGDDARVEDVKKRLSRIEEAIIILQAAPGELKAINARLDALRDGQLRLEKQLESRLTDTRKP